MTVSNGSKILIWKQITTYLTEHIAISDCFQWFKDTNLKANHNVIANFKSTSATVSNGSKILIWKQITTQTMVFALTTYCFQWFKDTNLKANHNIHLFVKRLLNTVSNGSKILIWKQITTWKCFLNWNKILFPMVQRY